LQLKGEIFTSEYSSAMLPKPAIEQREHNSERYADNISNPILHIRTASKGRLDKLYETAKSTRANNDGDQSKAACAGQWKGQSGESNEVHEFVDAIRRWGRLMDGPKHGDC